MIIWVGVWFVLVIVVTILNKSFFKTLNCPYPISITLIHMISCFIYSAIVKQVSPGFYQYRKLRRKEKSTLIKISVLFVLNLVLSNSSIKFNSLALDQMFRCSIPAITAILQLLLFGKRRSTVIYISLIPVIVGTMLVCLGDISYTGFGIILLIVSGITSSIKGIVTNRVLSGRHSISPLQLLEINSFFGSFELFILAIITERKFFTEWLPSASFGMIALLILHGFLAFLLNIANFQAVKAGGPLMMNVVGNVKQVVMVILSVYLFGQKMKPIGVVGSGVAILGSLWYSSENSKEKKKDIKSV